MFSKKKRTFRRGNPIGCGVKMLSAVALLIVGSCVEQRWHSIRPVLNKVHPGMNYEEVLRMVPSRLVREERSHCTNIPIGSFMVATNTTATTYMYIASTVSWIESMEVGRIYFDSNDKVVAVYFSSDGGRWAPRWGLEVGVTRGHPPSRTPTPSATPDQPSR